MRKLYTLGGSPIHGLDSLEDGGMYVASSGDKFKRVPYRLDQNEPIVNGPTLERGRPTTRFRRGESVLSTGPTCDFDAHVIHFFNHFSTKLIYNSMTTSTLQT